MPAAELIDKTLIVNGVLTLGAPDVSATTGQPLMAFAGWTGATPKSTAGTGWLRFDSGSNAFQMSVNAGAWTALGTGAGAVEPDKQIVYGTGTGVDSSANLAWDSNQLMIQGKVRVGDTPGGGWGTNNLIHVSSANVSAAPVLCVETLVGSGGGGHGAKILLRSPDYDFTINADAAHLVSMTNSSAGGFAFTGGQMLWDAGGGVHMTFDVAGNLVLGASALTTTATAGFFYSPSMPGTPTGVPTTFSGHVPFVFDTTGDAFWFYSNAAWHRGSGTGASTLVVMEDAVALTVRPSLNFAQGLTAIDNAGATRIDVTNDFATGLGTAQTLFGGASSAATLTISSTSHATKGKVFVGSGITYNEATSCLGTNTTAPTSMIDFRATDTTSVRLSIDAGVAGAVKLQPAIEGNVLVGTATDHTGSVLNVGATRTLASATSLAWDGIRFGASTLTLSGSTAVTTATGVNYTTIQAPTVTSSLALTVTNSATLFVSGAPTTSGSATITNKYGIWSVGDTRLDGRLSVGGQPLPFASTSFYAYGTGLTNSIFETSATLFQLQVVALRNANPTTGVRLRICAFGDTYTQPLGGSSDRADSISWRCLALAGGTAFVSTSTSSTATMRFFVGGESATELRLEIDPTGRAMFQQKIGVGSGTPTELFHGFTFSNTPSTTSCILLQRSRGTSTSPVDVSDNDILGEVRFAGRNGAAMVPGGYIQSKVTGTGEGLDTKLCFGVGQTSTAVEQMTLDSQGELRVAGGVHGEFVYANEAFYPETDASCNLGFSSLRFAEIHGAQLYVTDIIEPHSDNTCTLGSASKRWSLVRGVVITSGDLDLGYPDGAGEWTLREGPHDLFAENKRTGKRYRLKLEEVVGGEYFPPKYEPSI